MAQMVDDFKASSVRHSDELELLVQCHDVVKGDTFSRSDPFVKVYEKRSNRIDPDTGKKIEGFVLVGETEHFNDTSDPVFETKFKIEYFFEESQILRFECYDFDKNGKHDLLGACEMNLGKILNSPGSIRSEYLTDKKGKRLKNGQTKMYQTVTAELNFLNAADRDIMLQFQPKTLTKMDTFGSADAFFRIYRIDEATKKKVLLFSRVSEKEDDDKNPWILWNYKKLNKAWPPLTLSYQSLCDCDSNKVCINIEVWDCDKSSTDDMIGECTLSLSQLQSKKDFTLHKAKYGNKDRGTISVIKCEVLPTMIDFVQGGTELSLICAIDFTGSNGEPQDKDSLHYIEKNENGKFTGKPSQYQRAIRSIGKIVEAYDSDRMFPVYGFGLAVKDKTQKWQTYHNMQLNRWINHKESNEVKGIYGIEELYKKTIETIITNENLVLSGPTNFSPVLNEAFKRAKQSHNDFIKSEMEGKLTYHILLLLTDGAISENDEMNTKSLIVEACNEGYPLSIIIVGIGNSEFGFLEELDNDDPKSKGFVNSMGVKATRDIVQFVKFSSYGKIGGYEKLAKDTLHEIPKQFLSYITKHNVKAPPRTEKLEDKGKFKIEDALDSKESMYEVELELEETDEQKMLDQQKFDPFLDAPLPEGWERAFTAAGAVYYVNHSAKATQWMHPDDPSSPQNKA